MPLKFYTLLSSRKIDSSGIPVAWQWTTFVAQTCIGILSFRSFCNTSGFSDIWSPRWNKNSLNFSVCAQIEAHIFVAKVCNRSFSTKSYPIGLSDIAKCSSYFSAARYSFYIHSIKILKVITARSHRSIRSAAWGSIMKSLRVDIKVGAMPQKLEMSSVHQIITLAHSNKWSGSLILLRP